jgi:alkylation response protein AidB-like acyl-CoA dehydrogenase
MDVLPDEQEIEIQDAARAFLAAECPPSLARQAEHGAERYCVDLWRKFAENGWLQLCLPEDCGGQALPLNYLGLLFEAIGNCIAPLPLHATMVPALALARHGTGEQRRALARVVRGELILCHAIAEDDGAWSTDAITLRGRREGDEIVLDGTKAFVDGFHAAQACLVLFADADHAGRPGAVLVPTDASGLSASTLITTAKDGSAMLSFKAVRVPMENRLGAPDEGAAIARELMDYAAVLYASLMGGAARHALDMAVEHAKQREAFGQPIGAFQAIQHLCADMLNAIDGTLLLTREALWRMGQGLPAGLQVAQAKAFASQHCVMACRAAQQIHGGMGFMQEFDLNLWYRRVASWSLRGGTIAEHRRTVAAALLDDPRRTRLGGHAA